MDMKPLKYPNKNFHTKFQAKKMGILPRSPPLPPRLLPKVLRAHNIIPSSTLGRDAGSYMERSTAGAGGGGSPIPIHGGAIFTT